MRTTDDSEYVKAVSARAYDRGLHFDNYGLWQFHPNDPAQVVDPTQAPKDRCGRSKKLPQILTNGYWELLPSETEEEILSQLDLPPPGSGMMHEEAQFQEYNCEGVTPPDS